MKELQLALAKLRRRRVGAVATVVLGLLIFELRRRWRRSVTGAIALFGLSGQRKEGIRKIVENCPSLQLKLDEPGSPLQSHGLTHTALSTALVELTAGKVEYDRRQEVLLDDGGTIALDWLDSPEADCERLLFAVHGLSGDSQSPHERRIVHYFHAQGWEVCAFNMRGSGGVPLTTEAFTTLWCGGDVMAGLRAARAERPNAKICIICVSMGAAITMNALGKECHRIANGGDDDLNITGVVCISPPFDPEESSSYLHGSLMRRLVSVYLAQRLKVILFRCGLRVPWLALDVYQVERSVVCSLHGLPNSHEGVLEYYRGGSPKGWIKHLKIPTLILAAEDDPVIPPHTLPHDEAEESEGIVLAVTKRGGHVGFMWRQDWGQLAQSLFSFCHKTKSAAAAQSWLPRACEEFLLACC